MNILITGICGLIGANLSRALIEYGHVVVGLDNLSVGMRDNAPPCDLMIGDTQDIDKLYFGKQFDLIYFNHT